MLLLLAACASAPAVPLAGSPVGLLLLWTHPETEPPADPAPDRAGEAIGLLLSLTRNA